MVEHLDAVKIGLNQCPGCDASFSHRFLFLGDGRFGHFKGLGVGALDVDEYKCAEEKTSGCFHLEMVAFRRCVTDGKRVAVLTPVESAEAPKPETRSGVALELFRQNCGGGCPWANDSDHR